MATTTVLISSFPPFPSLTLTLSSDTPLAQLPSLLPDYLPFEDVRLSLPSRALPLDQTPLKALWDNDSALSSGSDTSLLHHKSSHASRTARNSNLAANHTNDNNGVPDDSDIERLQHRLVSLRLSARLRGGKGGFGSQLRAAGGRMSSQKTSNNDSCRDLNGRRLSTIKEAKALAAYLESEPERRKAQQEAQRAKLEKLERKLGIDESGKAREEGSSSGGPKRRFDDTEYIEQSKDIVDNVKSAVTAGLLKKRKKAKPSPLAEGSGSGDPVSASASVLEEPMNGEKPAEDTNSNSIRATTSEVIEKALESPLTAPVSAGVAVSLAAIGA